jgi:MFS family permease
MTDSGVKVYGYRWVVLGAFMFINLTIQILWICYAPISGPAAQYYHVSDLGIGLLAMVFMVVYIPAAIPASWVIDRFGLRKGVGLGAALLGIFGLLRGVFAEDYQMVFFCTLGIALAQPLLLNSYTTVAAKWFPLKERATASGLAMASNYIGTTIGLMLTPHLFNRLGIISTMRAYGLLTALSSLVFLALAREKPPTPSSPAGQEQRALMLDGLRMILKQGDFRLCMFVFFVGFGIFNGLATWIENIVRPKGLTPNQAGMVGGVLLIGGIIGAFIVPMLSDHYRRRKPFILAGMAAAIPCLLGFTFAHTYSGLLGWIFALGFFMMGLGPIGYQYGAEITFPAPEGTSNGLLVLAGQISVVFIFAMEFLNKRFGSFTSSLVLGAGLLLLNCFLVALLKESKILQQQ